MSAVTSLKGRTARTEKNPDGLREPCKERERKSRRRFLHQDRVAEPPAAQQLGRRSGRAGQAADPQPAQEPHRTGLPLFLFEQTGHILEERGVVVRLTAK